MFSNKRVNKIFQAGYERGIREKNLLGVLSPEHNAFIWSEVYSLTLNKLTDMEKQIFQAGFIDGYKKG